MNEGIIIDGLQQVLTCPQLIIPFFAHVFSSKTSDKFEYSRSLKSWFLKVVIEASVMQQSSSHIKSNVTKQMGQISKLVKIQILGKWS